MKKSLLVLFAISTALILFVVACSKDQRTVNRLDGTWKVTSEKVNGVAEPDTSFANTTYTFNKCKVKDGPCSGNITEDGKSFPFTYQISEKGTKMTITFLGVSQVADITENTKKKFSWKMTSGNMVTETTIEKK